MGVKALHGDCRDVLPTLADASVHCVVTSPPYFGLRDYKTATWEGGDPGCGHGVRRWEGAKQTQGAQSGHAAKADRLNRAACQCGAVRVDRQIGQEATLDGYVAALVAVFREVRRVLRDDGVCWLNLGDSYASTPPGNKALGVSASSGLNGINGAAGHATRRDTSRLEDVKPKDLLLVPARVALALQAGFARCDGCGLELRADLWPRWNGHKVCMDCRMDGRTSRILPSEPGWWVRSDVIWAKESVMPESVTDRPTSAHEHVFLLAKSGEPTFWLHRDGKGARPAPAPDYRWINGDAAGAETAHEPPGWTEEPSAVDPERKRWRRVNLWRGQAYFYDAGAIKEAAEMKPQRRLTPRQHYQAPGMPPQHRQGSRYARGESGQDAPGGKRNARNVWTINPQAFLGAHFATMPATLAERCIRAGTSERGCCPACGAPWARVVERGEPDLAHQRACGGDANGAYAGQSTKGHAAAGVQDASAVKARILAGMVETRTTGWQPTCACPPHDPVPCTVLDPFSGAGTTGLVASRLQRAAVLIELNPAFGSMGAERIHADAPLFSESTIPAGAL